jgi:predicted  nucleic acid-binding Zn-ribbon protein
MEKIEQLRKEVDSIKESLNTLKNNIDIPVNERKNQAKTLKDKAEETKQKIEVEINNLDGQTKTEAQDLLNKSMNEITELYTSIVNTPNSTVSSPVQPLTEDKNFFTKTKDWI